MQEQQLTIHRGAVFHAHAWPLVDSAGSPLRDTTGLTVVAKARRWRGADAVLHTFATSAVLLTLPGLYGGEPVAAAQINAMTPEQTSALAFESGVFDVLVNDEPIVDGLLSAPQVVSRS